jgi:non-heme chloroperoxidase
MRTVTTTRGVFFYKDWGRRRPSHRLSPRLAADHRPLGHADAVLSRQGLPRYCALDRLGHGRSTQVSDDHDMDHYAPDTNAIVEHLRLKNAVHIGHSTGGGQATRYVARHGHRRS